MKKLLIILLLITLCGCNKSVEKVDIDSINNIDFSSAKEIDLDLYAQEYLIVNMSTLDVMYAKDIDKKIYPASLTKVMTLDTVLSLVDNLDETSSYTYDQLLWLLEEDASLAGLYCDEEYTIRDLLYALILPSGADGAICLENYFNNKGIDLVQEMNKRAKEIGCECCNFTNTTGLHDENHYMCVNDIFKIYMDVLKFEEGRVILETLQYQIDEDTKLTSSVVPVYVKGFDLLGGKTGYTPESGRSISVLYRKDNRSYLMILCNCKDDGEKQLWHYIDAIEIFENLY